MIGRNRARLLSRAFWELLRYDAISACFGFPGIRRAMGAPLDPAAACGERSAAPTVEAVACITSFYWKPLLCLERSIVTTRLLRAEGVPADVVIGYRPRPFRSHAWVEVHGRVVNDSPAYQTEMQPLDRF